MIQPIQKSLALFYFLKFTRDDIPGLVMFIAALQWLWSVKNLIVGPLKTDPGILSWILLVYARYTENAYMSFLVCSFQVLAFGFIFGMISKSKPWQTDFMQPARKLNMTKRWAMTFFWYLLGHSVFWAYCARDFYLEWQMSSSI